MYQQLKRLLSGQKSGVRHLNRSVIVVYPKAPYERWTGEDLKAGGLDPEKDGTAYLIPMMQDLDEFDDFLEQTWSWLFAQQLSMWTEDDATWPQDRSLQMFRQWFEVRVADMVVDIAGEPLRAD